MGSVFALQGNGVRGKWGQFSGNGVSSRIVANAKRRYILILMVRSLPIEFAGAITTSRREGTGERCNDRRTAPRRPWLVWVSGNWRLTFTFDGEDAILVDYQDYH